MPGTVIRPLEACLNKAARQKTALALAKVGLFKSSYTPDAGTTKADLDANETDFTGYAQVTITAWGNPYIHPVGGAAINSGTIQFDWATGSPDVNDNVGGWWIETAAGKLELVGSFADPVPMDGAGKSIVFFVDDITGIGQVA
jgi:hypothetical protein